MRTSLCFTSPIIYLLEYPLPGAAVHMLIDSQVSRLVDLSQRFTMEFICAIAIDVEHQHLIGTDPKKLLSTEVR